MSIRRTLILLFVCLVSQPTVSLGQEAPRSFSLGKLTSACELFENQLRAASSGPVTVEGAGAGFCSGFIWAVAGFSHIVSNGPKNDCSKGLGPNCRPVLGICVPGSMSDKQMVDVFLTYARSHAEQWHEEASPHVLKAMQEAFPCK
jgi:hypothetical protein